MHPDQLYRVALSRVAGIGPKLFRALLTHFSLAETIFSASATELGEVEGIGPETALSIRRGGRLREAEDILRTAERHGIQTLSYQDEGYPRRLHPFPEAPAVLYYRGEADLQSVRTLALVGTRNMSAASALQVERLLEPLADYDPLVVSGLAHGIDVCAHRTALRLQLPTVGVLGSGLSHLYPHGNRQIARRMVEEGGGLLTEYPHFVKPEREHFPARNRIVAMLSDLVIVVESRRSGGSMITADIAHRIKRPLAACPGTSNAPATAGCNHLIKSGKAHLVEDGNDVTELLGWTGPRARGTQRKLFEELDPTERQIVERLRDSPGVELDDLRLSLQIPPARLAGKLLGLELRELIVGLPGGRYRLHG